MRADENLTITWIQCELFWEDILANLNHFEKWFDRIDRPTDLIVLPEMFTTGFTMNAASVAQEMDGDAVAWIRTQARKLGADIAGSMVIREKGRFYNRLVWAGANGALYTYDKRHLFRMAGEETVYSAGRERLTVDLLGWKIRPFICYDLRFPVWMRNLENAYDIAVCTANWPAGRSAHWKILLQARAIENQCYMIGVNRVGTGGKGLRYSGDSAVIDPMGNVLFQQADVECVHTRQLSFSALQKWRTEFPVWMDAESLPSEI
ncbi:MAG: amidohydrolase [Desulfobacterales bacterium]|nr:amidohydrolase [Desulfobacterales bacterium]MDD3080846.1 amidohydrolase [Desulfobacterales bacterium]